MAYIHLTQFFFAVIFLFCRQNKPDILESSDSKPTANSPHKKQDSEPATLQLTDTLQQSPQATTGADETDKNNHGSLNQEKSSLNTSISIEVTDTQASMELISITGLRISACFITPLIRSIHISKRIHLHDLLV